MLLTVLLMSISNTSFASQIEVKVKGMVCSMCAQGIQKKFKQLPGVKSLAVNLDNKLVSIETNQGEDVSDAVITKLIKEAGYNVERIERK
jgi:mercuric ion binding protein